MVIELLRRWSELEPERCAFVDKLGITGKESYFRFEIPGWHSAYVDAKEDLPPTQQWTICGAIEAAIVEREFRMMAMYGKSLQNFEFGWTVFVGDGTKQEKGTGSTKLEALLSAYVAALEATK